MAMKISAMGQSLCRLSGQPSLHTLISRHMSRAAIIEHDWATNPRWEDVQRRYTPEDVCKLAGSVKIEHSLAKQGAEKLWKSMKEEPYIHALGAVTGNQAIQMIRAGLKAIYVSGWQVAADANVSGEMYPDQSLYPYNSVPNLVRNINKALLRADQIDHAEGGEKIDWLRPMVADCEAGFGGVLNAYELVKYMIEAGASGVHFEDQLSSAKKCGHMGGKVLVPTNEAIDKLVAARLAADVMNVPTIIVARTDAEAGSLLTTDLDENDKPFCTGERTDEGYFRTRAGVDQAISRGLAYAPFCDLIWCETARPNMEFAAKFADAIHAKYPNKMLAYNCSPSFNWKQHLTDDQIINFQKDLGQMGYKFQFITLAGFHALNMSMFKLAKQYAKHGMMAFVRLQQQEFAAMQVGYSAVMHQREVGTGYFDNVTQVIKEGSTTLSALTGSTEEQQFKKAELEKKYGKTKVWSYGE